MQSNIENEINQELEKERFINFYKKNKIKILFFALFMTFLIFGYQIKTIYLNNKNSENIEKILLSEIYLDDKKKEGLDILNKVKNTNNDTISILSSYKLIDFYLETKNEKKALDEIILLRNKIGDDDILMELLNIKEAIIRFDTIKEKEILDLLKTKEKKFNYIKKKILLDFYKKNNQENKIKYLKIDEK